MSESLIRWDRSATTRLGKAIANFNKKVNRLNQEQKLYLPSEYDYQTEKARITTRKELNRFIKSLSNFMKEGSEQLVFLDSGVPITEWEEKELNRNMLTATKRLEKEISGINRAEFPFETQQESTAKAYIKSMSNWKNLKGKDLERMKIRLRFFGSADVEMRKAILYREHYLKEMEKYKNFQNYDLLLEKMESIKNPLEFYNHIKDNMLVSDLNYQSDEYYTQAEFDGFVEEWGVKINKNQELTEVQQNLVKQYDEHRKERMNEKLKRN